MILTDRVEKEIEQLRVYLIDNYGKINLALIQDNFDKFPNLASHIRNREYIDDAQFTKDYNDTIKYILNFDK